MFIDYKSSSLRFTGRFAELNNTMTATAAGSAIEIAFKGDSILLKFDLADQKYPYPHLWMQLDGGAWIETQLDWYLRINANNTETHLAKIVLKSTLEMQERWNLPIAAKLSFVGAEVEETAVLPEDKRKTIEIIGDSITEGVLIDADKQPIEPETDCRTFQDDIFATYGYITAQNLNLRSYHVGYGAVGFTHGGCGNVPAVNNSYDYCFSGAPVTYGHPDFILINHGVNDTGWGADNYVHEYERFLKHLTEVHNTSKIIVLNNFRGSYKDETKEMVSRFNKEYGTDIFYIDSSGWVSFEPLHPLRDGHKIIAEHLIKILKEKYYL